MKIRIVDYAILNVCTKKGVADGAISAFMVDVTSAELCYFATVKSPTSAYVFCLDGIQCHLSVVLLVKQHELRTNVSLNSAHAS